MKSPDTDPDVVTGREAAGAFLAGGDLAALAPLSLPPDQARHVALQMAENASVPHAAAVLLGWAAHWLALQGNPAFGYGAAEVLSAYWRAAVPPPSSPAVDAFIRASYASSFGGCIVTMAIACNRAGWPERTVALADEQCGGAQASIGGEEVAVHLVLLAAEAHWLMRDMEATRRHLASLEGPPRQPGQKSLWILLQERLQEMDARASDSEPSPPDRWKVMCARVRAQIEEAAHEAPLDTSTPLGAEMVRRIQALYERLEREAAKPPENEVELLQRLPSLMQETAAVVNPAAWTGG